MAGWSNRTLLAAIRTRLLADTGTGGLFDSVGSDLVTAVWTRRFPLPTQNATDFPYVIVYFDAVEGGDAFAYEGKRIGIRVEWFTRENADGVDGLEQSDKVLERITGDFTDQSAGVPSYGLHRWTPTIQSGWAAGPLYFEGAGDESVSDSTGIIRWNAMFSVEVSKAKTA
jgi:hypothetical protein